MRRRTLIQVFLLFFMLVMGTFAEDRLIVRANPAALSALAQSYASLGVRVASQVDNTGQVAVLSVPDSSTGAWLAGLLKEYPGVEAVEVDAAVSLPRRPSASAGSTAPKIPALHGPKASTYANSPVWGPYVNQPAVAIVGIDKAQTLATGRRALVATIDTGVDFFHPALRGALVAGTDLTRANGTGDESLDLTGAASQEFDQETTPILDGGGSLVLRQETTPILDFDQETTPILDSSLPPAWGHGTMVAGLIHLVAPNAMIMPVKVFDANGTASMSQVIAGIYFAVKRGADVLNMSFSSTQSSDELKKAIAYAVSNGVICVASVGNDGGEVSVFPAAYDSIIGVGSTNNMDTRSLFSNFGSTADLAAPGEGLITTYPRNNYAAGWGTSFSTPLVAGAAALLVDLGGRLSVSAATADLSQAVPIGQGLGAGRLDIVKALNYQLSNRGK